MNVKTYRAASMVEALSEVKQELGRDAVILHTRNFRRGGLFGLGGREVWEITASTGINVPRRAPGGQYVPASSSPTREPKRPAATGAAPRAPAAPQASPETPVAPLASQVRELKDMVQTLLTAEPADAGRQLPAHLARLREGLIEQEVEAEIADELVRDVRYSLTGEQMENGGPLREKLRELVAARITVCGGPAPKTEGRARIVAVIGPTGVGKTTTIAKLAADYKLREGLNVGLITIDTYRIAAVDQLRTYGDIIEVPVRAVLTAGELHEAVHSMRDLDVVLIDTAGRSQNNQMRLNQLRGFLAAAAPDEVHLAVTASASRPCVTSTLRRFLPLGVDRIMLTKVDEAVCFGVILTISRHSTLGFSYVTTGQDVPEDIALADANILSDWIVEGSVYAN